MGNKKARGEDGITGENYKSAFEIFPIYIKAMYNGFLNRGVFPMRWKRTMSFPVTRPDKDNSDDVTKFRPIGFLNTVGKVLHVHSHNCMNNNHYGFTPQKSTIDAAIAVKNVVSDRLAAKV